MSVPVRSADRSLELNVQWDAMYVGGFYGQTNNIVIAHNVCAQRGSFC